MIRNSYIKEKSETNCKFIKNKIGIQYFAADTGAKRTIIYIILIISGLSICQFVYLCQFNKDA